MKRHELREMTRGRRKEIVDRVVTITHDYRQGRSPSACMAEIERLIRQDQREAGNGSAQ